MSVSPIWEPQGLTYRRCSVNADMLSAPTLVGSWDQPPLHAVSLSPISAQLLCSINSKAKNSHRMMSEGQGHLKTARGHWTPPYRIKWQEGTPGWSSCSKNRKHPRSRLGSTASGRQARWGRGTAKSPRRGEARLKSRDETQERE